MSWFLFALIATFGWGLADLFYKKGSTESDRYSHLKIAVWVGFVMGICSFLLLPFSSFRGELSSILPSALRYTPASVSYIISMVIGYAGMRYLEISIISPVQNASGAFSAICIAAWFLLSGKIDSLCEELMPLDWIGTVLIVLGVIALAIVEQKLCRGEHQKAAKKYRYGALALLFPILYCIFDTIGTAADGILLDEETGMGLGEIEVLILYGLTFFVCGIGAYLYLWWKEKKPYNPFLKQELPKGIAALAEEFGQVFYVFAMSGNPILAPPMIASYCIVSIILSRIFLREKLTLPQTVSVAFVVVGIVILGISEGIAARS